MEIWFEPVAEPIDIDMLELSRTILSRQLLRQQQQPQPQPQQQQQQLQPQPQQQQQQPPPRPKKPVSLHYGYELDALVMVST